MSHSDGELKVDENKLKLRKNIFKAKKKYSTDLINRLKSHLHPELQEQRLLKYVATHNTEAAEKLLNLGVNANSSDRQLRSALHIAASRGYADIVELLLKHGANPNRRDIIQNTPLHLAACTSNLKIITLLLDWGGDIQSLDLHGRNPLQLAESKLQILQRNWKQGAIELQAVRSQLKEIVDIMISLCLRKESTPWRHNRTNVDDLELIKLSISDDPTPPVADQMNKLLLELQEFSIK